VQNEALLVTILDIPRKSPSVHSAGQVLKKGDSGAGGGGGISSNGTNNRPSGASWDSRVGHIGLTPQSVHQLGYRQQGKTPAAEENFSRSDRAGRSWSVAVVWSISQLTWDCGLRADANDWHWSRSTL